MDLRLQLVAVTASLLLLGVVFELVRRKQLLERYALLWLFSAFVLLLLAAWSDLLAGVANLIGIFYPPSALFTVAFAFVLLLLLHFSLAVSRLADQSKVLAQRLALLEERQRASEQERERELAVERAHVGQPGHGNGERNAASSKRRTSAQ
jgi:hypothetical protein